MVPDSVWTLAITIGVQGEVTKFCAVPPRVHVITMADHLAVLSHKEFLEAGRESACMSPACLRACFVLLPVDRCFSLTCRVVARFRYCDRVLGVPAQRELLHEAADEGQDQVRHEQPAALLRRVAQEPHSGPGVFPALSIALSLDFWVSRC